MTRLCKKQQLDLTSLPLLERPCFTFSNDYISSQNKHGLVQVSDRIIARFDYEIFFFPTTVKMAMVSEFLGQLSLNIGVKFCFLFFLLYHGNSYFIIYLLHVYVMFNFSTGSLPHLALRVILKD